MNKEKNFKKWSLCYENFKLYGKKFNQANMQPFTLTKVKIFSDCVIKAILDHPNCFMTCIIPKTISASLDTVLRKRGNILVLDRRGDDEAGEI